MRISLLLCCVAVLVSTGCASKPKSANRIYEGDAPTIHYTGQESAGGPLGGR